jgi:Putative Ig domain
MTIVSRRSESLFQYCVLTVLLCLAGFAKGATLSVSPSAVSNTYSGNITLQIGDLTNGETVVVQKFLDLNTNGVIDGADWLVQQFTLTDGQASVFHDGAIAVTNFNVPCDLNSTTGAITAQLNFNNGDFIQKIAGKYAFTLSSPVGRFAPVTNLFNVTNFPYAQLINGTVRNSGTNVPNAVVMLFPRPGDNGPSGNPQAGTVANNSGSYAIPVPPGTYMPVAFQSNYVADFTTSPILTLTNTQTITTNLMLTNATASISGKLVDAATNSIGLPGIFGHAYVNGLLSIGFTDTDGNFTLRVRSGLWEIGSDTTSLILHGYVGLAGRTNVNAGTTGLILPLPRATAVFYGSVKDNLGNPLTGIDIYANDSDSQMFEMDAYTDANGKYVLGVLGNNDYWRVQVNSDDNSANYIFSQGNSVAMTNGQAVKQSFTGILATSHISGSVQQTNGSPISGVGVWAQANIAGKYYQTYGRTDAAGNYALPAANGSWTVGLNCSGGDDSLQNFGNFQCPTSRTVDISDNNAAVNFTVWPPSPLQMTTASLPNGTKDVFYSQQFTASGGQEAYHWYLPGGTISLPPGTMSLSDDGILSGIPTAAGTYDFWVGVWDNTSVLVTQSFSLTIIGSSPLQVTTGWLPDATNGAFYSQTLQASGGQPPYSWSVPNYSADPPPNLTLATNGVLSGTLAANGTNYFDVEVTDGAANMDSQTLSLTIVNPPLPPLLITNASLPSGTVGAAYNAQLGATGGQQPYQCWSLALGSASLPPGLSLDCGGLISGTPTTNKVSTFKVQATDANSTTTNKVLSITINPKPVLGVPTWLTNRFQMRLTGASNQNYSVQISTNLTSTNWISLFVTNNAATNSFNIIDPTATNRVRFYRVLVGP